MNWSFLEKLLSIKRNRLLFFSSLSLGIFLFSYDFGLFWDNVLFASKLGNHLYYNHIFNWIIPNAFDSGHPPFLGFLLAVLWKIFGHHLWVAHLVMLPFTFGFFYQLFKFVFYFTKSYTRSFFGFLLIIIDPTLSAQLIIVNPEIIILFFFFLAINAILYKNNLLKVIALLFLSLISLRSMMICSGIFLFDVLNNLIIHKKRPVLTLKFILNYIIGSIPGVLYLLWRYIEKGWFLTHDNSPWANNHQFVNLKLFIRNGIVLIQRYADFGRIVLLFFLIFSFVKFHKKILKQYQQLVLLAFLPISVVLILSLLSTNPFGHRYFIISYIVLNLMVFLILIHFYKKRKALYILFVLALITGNLWIYPKKIAQGWDASLAHVPYYTLRDQAIKYLDNENIPIEKTASFFPNLCTIDEVDLNNDQRRFEQYNEHNAYIFYSNVYNLSDAAYDDLDKNYTIIKQFKKFRIHIYILKRKHDANIRRKKDFK